MFEKNSVTIFLGSNTLIQGGLQIFCAIGDWTNVRHWNGDTTGVCHLTVWAPPFLSFWKTLMSTFKC